jgi:hypothetical protein
MDKSEYRLLFEKAVARSLREAGLTASSCEPVVKFFGTPNPRHTITMDQALDLLWLSPDRYFFIVDVGAFPGDERPPVIFVRPSGHEPRQFSDTWQPDDLGPFKLIGLARGPTE